MEIIPAIDIIGGKCVRLTRGDYADCTTYFDDPVDVARRFEAAGMMRLHLVDLDGAKASRVVNEAVLRRICHATKLKVDFSGGIKSDDDVERVFQAGASFVGVGSMAQRDPGKTRDWLSRYGRERVIVGADVRGRQVCVDGWKMETATTLHELIDWYLPGLKYLACTDIARDGMLVGPSLDLYRELVARYPNLTLVASGGVRSREDVRVLEAIGVASVIVGKALYENRDVLTF